MPGEPPDWRQAIDVSGAQGELVRVVWTGPSSPTPTSSSRSGELARAFDGLFGAGLATMGGLAASMSKCLDGFRIAPSIAPAVLDELRAVIAAFATAEERRRVSARERSRAAIVERSRLARRYPPTPPPAANLRGFRLARSPVRRRGR